MHQGLHLASPEAARAELLAVLTSTCFQRSPRLSALLRYLCEKALAGDAHHLKEYTIGVEVLGRPASFDPSEDAGARVEIHRLRKRLKDYYLGEGAGRAIRIEIPSGQYSPLFVDTDQTKADDSSSAGLPVAGQAAGTLDPLLATAGKTGRNPWIALGALFALGVVAVGATFFRRPPTVVARDVSTTIVDHHVGAVRIACGRRKPFTDRWGRHWEPDSYFEGGQAYTDPRAFLDRAFDPHLYSSGRIGDFEYRIPVAAGPYEIHLLFAETGFGAGNPGGGGEGSRLFDVSVNGRVLLKDFDVISDAGGPSVADVRVFKDITPAADGHVTLAFHGSRDKAMVSAIELVPSAKGRLNPIRMAARSHFYTDTDGNVWTPENYVSGGQILDHAGPMRGSDDPELFASERYGNFSYAVPVDGGSYKVTLHLAERSWGPGGMRGGGTASRLFDVVCNGQVLIRNLDLFAEVGRDRVYRRTIHDVAPNGQGKLLLSFVPRRDYASVYAIEIEDTR